jgi:hypothetical protein
VPRVDLGVLVTGNTYRHPAVLAKMAATADHISGGRIVLGLGAGWQENEHRAYGIEFSDAGRVASTASRRRARSSPRCSPTPTTFDGEHYQLTDAPLEPKPLQSPLPLLIGGGGEKRTMRIAAKYAHEWNVWGTPRTLRHKNAVLERHCEDLGRDPAEITRSAQGLLFLMDDEASAAKMRERDIGRAALVGTPDQLVEIVAEYRDAGVDELIVPDFTLPAGAAKHEVMDRFIEAVGPGPPGLRLRRGRSDLALGPRARPGAHEQVPAQPGPGREQGPPRPPSLTERGGERAEAGEGHGAELVNTAQAEERAPQHHPDDQVGPPVGRRKVAHHRRHLPGSGPDDVEAEGDPRRRSPRPAPATLRRRSRPAS